MSGAQHYALAQRTLAQIDDGAFTEPIVLAEAAIAQVRATLALTAALVEIGMSKGVARDYGWEEVLKPRLGDDGPIEDLNLLVRAYNVLRREGVATVGQLCELTYEDLLDMRSMGVKAADNVRTSLEAAGRTLRGERDG